jgi:hypothetical protein
MSLIVISRDELAPKWECYVCGGTFHTLGVFQRHIVRCSDQHEEELLALSWRAKNPHLFDPNVSGDVEFGRWVRENRQAILDGRLKM